MWMSPLRVISPLNHPIHYHLYLHFPSLFQGTWLQELRDDFLVSLYSCLASKPSTAEDPEYSILFFSKYDAGKLLASLTVFRQRVRIPSKGIPSNPGNFCSPGKGFISNPLILIFFFNLILERAPFQPTDSIPGVQLCLDLWSCLVRIPWNSWIFPPFVLPVFPGAPFPGVEPDFHERSVGEAAPSAWN